MSRSRLIRPAFFKHAELYDAEVESGLPLRVAFAGLWTVADRDGRFIWKPRDMKGDVIPHDPVDMATVLDALVEYGFIRRYVVDGKAYGLIPSFKDQQSFHKSEPHSKLPAPPQTPVDNGATTVRTPVDNGVSRKSLNQPHIGGDTVRAPGDNGESRAVTDTVAVTDTDTDTDAGADNATSDDREIRKRGRDPETEKLLDLLAVQLFDKTGDQWPDIERFLKSRKYQTWGAWLREFSKLTGPGSQFTSSDLARACSDALALEEPLAGPHALRAFIAKARADRLASQASGGKVTVSGPSLTESAKRDADEQRRLEDRYQRDRRAAGMHWALNHPEEAEKISDAADTAPEIMATTDGPFRRMAIQAYVVQKRGEAARFPSFDEWLAQQLLAAEKAGTP